jgi:hypothetical protein
MKGFREFSLILLVAMIGMASLVALYLFSWRLSSGGPISWPTEAPLLWCWENITLHLDYNRWLDPLWAALWAIIPGMLWCDRRKFDDIECAPFFGLVGAGGIYLSFWGNPGLLFWPTMVLPAVVIGRFVNLVNWAQARQYHSTAEQYNYVYALCFVLAFGSGALLPQALLYGFHVAFIMLWAYTLLGFVTCTVLYSLLLLARIFMRLYNKILQRRITTT